ncbi:MAG: acyl-CoA dehydrogenase family protein [Deltaproteobacteria bacterium]|nr:acyl-CoA dehydrogenase family protein [Deltaproteobacteria bacterium]
MAWTFYTDEQKQLAERYRLAAREHIAPRVREVDENDRLPQNLLERLVKPPFSLTALSVPKKFGGLEMSKVDVCIVAEEMGYALPCLVPFLEIAQLYTHVLKYAGTENQQKRFLEKLATGAKGCYALTDEGPGSDPTAMKTTAKRDGDFFVLRGKKRLITFADIADLFAIFATEDPSLGADGISAFIVEKGTPGLNLAYHCKALGLMGHRAWDMDIEDVRVPVENRIGERGDGLRLAFKVLNKTRISLSFGYVGLARAAIEKAVEFARTRVVQGRPISEHQAISFAIADAAIKVEAARLLAYRAAVLSDKTDRHRKETSMAKAYAAEALIDAVNVENRVLGGYGGDGRYDAERHLRDAYSWISAQGTIEVQKVIAGREILGG